MAGWDLFQEMDMLRREIDQAFRGVGRSTLNPSFLPGIGTGDYPRINLSEDEESYYIEAVVPAVDIFESDANLTLMADMPGVDKEGLEINRDKGILTINGDVKLPGRGQTLKREFADTHYHRQFKLSEHIDTEKTSAELVNGVLTLTIPKAESAKPKRIEIRH